MGEDKLEQVEQSGEFRKSLYCAAFKTRKVETRKTLIHILLYQHIKPRMMYSLKSR